MAIFKKNIFKLCIFWVLTFILLIPSVSAEEVNVGYYTNNTEVLLDVPNAGAPIGLNKDTNNSAGAFYQLWLNIGNISINKDYIYSIEFGTPNAKLTNVNSAIVVQTTGGTATSQTCDMLGFTDLDTSYPKIYFQCLKSFSNGTMTITLSSSNTSSLTPQPNTFQWHYTYLRYYTEDTDIDLGPVISNQTQNTQNIINNNNNNTQQIIDNQNELLGSKCSNEWNPSLKTSSSHRGITFTPVLKNGVVEKYVINGTRTSGSNAYVVMNSNITITKGTHIKVYSGSGIFAQLYDGTNAYNFTEYTATETKTWNSLAIFTTASSIDNVDYKLMISTDSSAPFCVYGTYNSKLDDLSGAINDVSGAITNDDIGSSTSDASDFINNFSTNTFGLTSIITAPLTLIQSLTSSVCTDLELPLPFLDNKNLTLPCMTTIYSTYFGSFFTIYQTITYGIIAYWVIVRIFNQVKDFKNPEHDEIEVLDL